MDVRYVISKERQIIGECCKMLAKPGEIGSWVTLATDIIHNQEGQEVFLHIPTPYLHVILIFRKDT